MFATFFRPEARRLRRRVAMILGGLTLTAAGLYSARGLFVEKARAQAPPARTAEPAFNPNPSDYQSRVVAYVHGGTAVTRQELGEYLVARVGADKIATLVNKRILDRECWARGVVVTAAEVDAALAAEMRGLALSQADFLKTVKAKHNKNLVEFKEDVVRPRLQVLRLVAGRVTVSADDLRKAFESMYGEKVEGRLILWPRGQEQWAIDNYARLRDNEAVFDEAARNQKTSSLAAGAGKIRPITRYSMDEKIEKEAFRLRPGQVSELINTPEGVMVFKCDKRLPADTAVNFEASKEKIAEEMKERKLQAEMAAAFQALRDQAKPQIVLKKAERLTPGPVPSPSSAVAYLGSQAVTREELGEFLIARFGPEKLELMINRKILEQACAERQVELTEAAVDAQFDADLKGMNMTRPVFEKEMLTKWGKTLLEWREDVIRPKMMLSALAAGRVKVTDEDLKKGFEAYHGERLECRMVLFSPEQHKFALSRYVSLRDDEAEFDRAARSQPVPSLASQAGKIPAFGRHALGDENLEREAFRLQPGEVSALVGTPQGHVLLKCDKRIPPDTGVTLDQVREKLTKEIHEKKTVTEMQVVFGELKAKANPRLLLRPSGMAEDVTAEARKALEGR
ncbi:MAG: peptidylprolyl isomerase [Gemmataceae bacterium]